MQKTDPDQGSKQNKVSPMFAAPRREVPCLFAQNANDANPRRLLLRNQRSDNAPRNQGFASRTLIPFVASDAVVIYSYNRKTTRPDAAPPEKEMNQ
jgi:hypothetical protein